MGGMKTGAGEDPFADDTNGDDGDREVITNTADGRKSTTPSRERRSSRRGDEDDDVRPGDLPLIARRNARGDNVKAGRETRRLFELRPDVAEKESAFMTELESRLETDVAKTDAREAALDVIYDRPGLVADRLEEWGINYFDDTA